MTDIIQQIIGAIIAIVIALGGCVAYFWGTNWLLDKFLSDSATDTGDAMTRRDTLRSQISRGSSSPRRSSSSPST